MVDFQEVKGTKRQAKTRKLAIVGFNRFIDRFLARRETFTDVWSVNNSHAAYGYKPSLIVAMDDFRVCTACEEHEHVAQMKDATCPVLTSVKYPEFPKARGYPVESMLDFLGLPLEWITPVLSNTWNFSVAYALQQGFTDITLFSELFYGEDDPQTLVAEARKLKPGVPDWHVYHSKPVIRKADEPGVDGLMFLCGWALARGIQIHIPQGSPFMDGTRPFLLYGWPDQNAAQMRVMKHEAAKLAKQLDEKKGTETW